MGILPQEKSGEIAAHGADGRELEVPAHLGSDSGMDDDDFFLHHAWTAPVPGVPAALRSVVTGDPDPTRARRSTNDFPFMHHTARDSDGQERKQLRDRVSHVTIRLQPAVSYSREQG